MKIKVDVDCTPEEARRFLGLPDLTPVHEAYVERMTKAASEGLTAELAGGDDEELGPDERGRHGDVARDARGDERQAALSLPTGRDVTDTIFALSSGSPPAAVAIVRISGPRRGRGAAALAGTLPEPRRATLAASALRADEPLDHALVLRFPGPAQRDRRGCRRAPPPWRPRGGGGGAGRRWRR